MTSVKKQFVFKAEDGTTYQGKLPIDARDQLKMSKLLWHEQDPSKDACDVIKISNELDDLIYPLSNIVQGDKELLVWGETKQGLQMKHLAQLVALYRKELIHPLVG